MLTRKTVQLSRESGLSLLEVVLSLAILSVLVVGAMTYHSAAYKSTNLNQDRTFCVQKAIQITNELREETMTADVESSLWPYDQIPEDPKGNPLDPKEFLPVLSTQFGKDPNLGADPNLPANPISGNTLLGNRWKFQRQIDIRRFDYSYPSVIGEPLLVTVRCFYTDASNPNKGGIPLAEITTVMRSQTQDNPPTQTFDLYALAVDNTPGWWVSLSTLRPVVENAVNSLQATNPGLGYRVHWITRHSFGRDKSYVPFINTDPAIATGTYGAVEAVYYYAGLLHTNDGSKFWVYNPNFLKQGKINPGLVTNLGGVNVSDPMNGVYPNDPSVPIKPSNVNFVNNPVNNDTLRTEIITAGLLYDPADFPNTTGSSVDDDHYLTVRYSLADYYNHAVRYPEELTEYCMRKYGSLPQRNPIKSNMWDCIQDFPSTLPGLNAQQTREFRQRYTEPNLEPSLHMLMEQMYQDPDAFRNIMILNVHGELLPVPPVRNYSDAAKNPTPGGNDPRPAVSGFPYVRVVTHPEQVEYQNGSDVRLRVYSYVTDPNNFTTECDGAGALPNSGNTAILDSDCNPGTPNPANQASEVPIVIRISGVTFGSTYNLTLCDPTTAPNSGNLCVQRITGNSTIGYAAPANADISRGAGLPRMWYTARKWPNLATGPDLIILLYNSPLRHERCNTSSGCNASNGPNGSGLDSARRLYGMEYIPAPVENAADFSLNLVNTSTTNHKNTARWIITLKNPGNILNNNQLTIETRIGPRWATAAVPPEIPNPDDADKYIARALAQGYNPEDPNSYIPDGGLYQDAAGNYNFVTANNVPSNVSRTYAWIADLTCAGAGTNPCTNPPTNPVRAGAAGTAGLDYPYNGYRAPFTERFQFMGDPRHNPYRDVKLDNRYNWYFVDDASSASINGPLNMNGFAGFTGNANNGWTGRIPFDYPRLSQVYRMGILKSRSIYNSITGYSFFYVDPGNGMGGDQAWLPADLVERFWLRVPSTPFVNRNNDGNSTFNNSFVNLDTIAGWHNGRTRTVRQFNANPPTNTAWYAKIWLGELYPDILGNINMYDHTAVAAWKQRGWRARGNLPTILPSGLTPNTNIFKMDTEDQTYLNYDASRGGQDDSPPSFFNNTSKFNHVYWNASTQSTFQTCRGSEMANAFRFSSRDSIATARPFRTNQGSGNPSEFNTAPYNTALMRPNVTLFSPYYYQNTTTCSTNSFPNLLGSALVQMQLDPGNDGLDNDDLFGYFIMNGLAPANDSDPNLADNPNDFLTKFNLVSMNYGFMQTGQSTHPVTGAALPKDSQGISYNSIRQLPRVEITGPDPGDLDLLTQPSSLDVQWKISWRRWDGQLYTPDYTTNFCERTSSLYFIPMYSTDGINWRYVKNDAPVPRGPAPDDWRSRAPLPREDGGKQDPSAAAPFDQEHFILEEAANNNLCTLDHIYSQTWNTSNLTLDKDYILRVVVYRKDVYNHFSYHDLRIRLRS